jgi:hypothetical protein
MQDGLHALDLDPYHASKRRKTDFSPYTIQVSLRGIEAREAHVRSMEHTIHRQAAFGISAEILRNTVRWYKNGKFSRTVQAPFWVTPLVKEIVDAVVSQGFVGYKILADRVVIAVPCTLDIEYTYENGWGLKETHVEAGWKITFIDQPTIITDQGGALKAFHQSPSITSKESTERYSELIDCFKMRNFYNSRPAMFAPMSEQHKKGLNLAQFRNIAGDQHFTPEIGAGINRMSGTVQRDNVVQFRNQGGPTPVSGPGRAGHGVIGHEANFKVRMSTIANQVKLLDENTAIHRRNLKDTGASDQGLSEKYISQASDTHHIEHNVSMGRDCIPVRQMLSLADGEHMLAKASFDIFFAYRAPPQILGININAERTSINPRLNELVLDMFVASTSRIRDVIEDIFSGLVISGATLRFCASFSKYDCERLAVHVKPAVAAQMHADTYQMKASDFDLTRFQPDENIDQTKSDKALVKAETPSN